MQPDIDYFCGVYTLVTARGKITERMAVSEEKNVSISKFKHGLQTIEIGQFCGGTKIEFMIV